MLTKRFKLKQHTPLIHFLESKEEGTLRATELKPKLDAFLKEYAFHNDFELIKEFLSGYEKEDNDQLRRRWEGGIIGLDYLVRIKNENIKKPKIEEGDRMPTFFAHMGKKYDQAPKYRAEAETDLIFTSLHEELLDKIDKWIAEFFWLHNFGTRQSKGWGSFTVDGKSDSAPAGKGFYQFTVPDKGWEKCFKDIDAFYRVIRSGLNGIWKGGKRTHYCKPVIFEYASFNRNPDGTKTLVFQWEKKTIKQHLLADKHLVSRQVADHRLAGISDHPLTVTSREERDIRDLLGFSTEEDWRKYHLTISKEHDTIKRMRSPMHIKPVRQEDGSFKVYFRFNPVPKEFRDATLRFSNGKGGTRDIKVFDAPDDFMDGMIRFAATELDWDTFFKVYTDSGDPQVKKEGESWKGTITRIFEDIKRNLP